MTKKIKCALIGPGNIGTDLLAKLQRSPVLEPVWMVGIDPNSDGLKRAKEMGITVIWNPEPAKTPEGYYQIRGGIPYAIAKSLASAPFADILWMETKTANGADASDLAIA